MCRGWKAASPEPNYNFSCFIFSPLSSSSLVISVSDQTINPPTNSKAECNQIGSEAYRQLRCLHFALTAYLLFPTMHLKSALTWGLFGFYQYKNSTKFCVIHCYAQHSRGRCRRVYMSSTDCIPSLPELHGETLRTKISPPHKKLHQTVTMLKHGILIS